MLLHELILLTKHFRVAPISCVLIVKAHHSIIRIGTRIVHNLAGKIVKLLLVQGFCKQVRYLRIRVTILELYGFIQH